MIGLVILEAKWLLLQDTVCKMKDKGAYTTVVKVQNLDWTAPNNTILVGSKLKNES